MRHEVSTFLAIYSYFDYVTVAEFEHKLDGVQLAYAVMFSSSKGWNLLYFLDQHQVTWAKYSKYPIEIVRKQLPNPSRTFSSYNFFAKKKLAWVLKQVVKSVVNFNTRSVKIHNFLEKNDT